MRRVLLPLPLCLTKQYVIKAYRGADVQIHIILTSALTEVSGQLHGTAALPPGKRPGTHCIGCWVALIAGLGNVEERKLFTLSGLELQPISRPSRSLYRLRYPGSILMV
jgi:hypothetical protein